MEKVLDPILLTIAGPNGSGKTTITKAIKRHPWSQGCFFINPDEIAQQLFGGWNSPDSSLKAVQEAARQREDYLKNHVSFTFETVFSTKPKG